MIKLHTKHKSNLNYYLFNLTNQDDLNSISQDFEAEFGKQPLFSSFCTVNNKSYAVVGTLEYYDIDDFKFTPLKVFKSTQNDQFHNNQQQETFYLCNFKDISIIDTFLLPFLNQLINWKFDKVNIKKIPSDEDPLILYFRCAPEEIKYRIKILVPYFIQNELPDLFDNPVFTTQSKDIPVVIIKNINQSSQYQLNIHNFHKIKDTIEKKQIAKIISIHESKSWIYLSVENNDKAWEIINRFKYSKFHDDFLQFTHFLDIKDIEQVNQWKLLVLHIDKSENYQSIFEKYSKINENTENINSIKRILIIETYEESDSQNAKIQFLEKSDAYEAFRQDPENIKIFNFSMIVHHCDSGQEQTLSKIFKKATYIIEKQNNSQRTRPIYHVFFDSKRDLTEALLLSGNIEKLSTSNEDDDETTNTNYVYKLSRNGNPGIISNGLRIFCIAYIPFQKANKIDFQLIKQTWKQNTVRILDIDSNIQLSDALEALTRKNKNSSLESITFWKNSDIIASFTEHIHFKNAASKRSIKIKGNDYYIEDFNKY